MDVWERSQALESLEQMFGQAHRGGRVVLVAGEAGIGKTTLVSAFAATCRGRAEVMWGACDPLLTPRALGPLHDIAQHSAGPLAAAVAAGAGQAQLFAALIAQLTGPPHRRPRVIVIEDAHWADEATLDLIVFLGRRVDRLPALLLVTYRDDEIAADHPLRGAFAALPRPAVHTIGVTALSADCVRQQAALRGRDGAELYRLTGGNPLLVTEMLAVGAGSQENQVPSTVRDLVHARLRRLSTPARDIAQLVSVIPTSADAILLAHAADAVDECVTAGVLTVHAHAIGYRHELLRQAVEGSLTPPRRVELHRRVLAALAGQDGVDPARLAHHARLAGDTTALVRFGVQAAAIAAVQKAHREAVGHYRSVRPHVASLSEVDRARVLEAYAEQAYLAGMAADGLEPIRAAIAERQRLGDQAALGDDWRRLSRLAWWSADAEAAQAAAEQAVAILEPLGRSRALALAYSNLSQLHMLSHRLPEAIAWGERARELSDETGDVSTSVHAGVNVGTARMFDDHRVGAASLRSAHAAAKRADQPDHAARALVNLTTSYEQTGDYLAAAETLEEAFTYAGDHELFGYVQYLLGVRAVIRFAGGDWDAALTDAAQSLEHGGTGVAVVPALVAQGRILAARGLDAAPALTRAAREAAATGELQRVGPVAAAWAELHLLHGEHDSAAQRISPVLALAVERGHRWYAEELGYWTWRATGQMPVLEGEPATPYRLLMAGAWEQAHHAWHARGDHYRSIQALALGDRDAAVKALRALDRLGAVGTADRLRADLRLRGVQRVPRGPRPVSAGNAAGLTARQLQVLVLLGEGCSNADIARQLIIASKTVEHHVTAVLDKLDAATRGQAVAFARRRGLIS